MIDAPCLEHVLEHVSDAILVTDASWRIVHVNRAFERMSGFSAGEVVGRDPRFLDGEVADPVRHAEARRTLAAGETWTGYLVQRRPDGALYEVETRISPAPASGGGPGHAVWVERDVTDERELQRQMAEGQKMEAIGRFTAGIAHDFNNLLTVILGNAQILSSRERDPATRALCLDEILDAGGRAADLIRQLLLFGRREESRPVALDPNAFVVDIEPILRRLVREDIRLELRLGSDVPEILLDPSCGDQILMNLCANARDAMPTGGRLTIETGVVTVDGVESVSLSVTDTGTGIAPEDLPSIYEPFFTTRRRGAGSGLGLATVRHQVERHGGSIRVRSTPGQGTRFEVLFPRRSSAPEEPVGGDGRRTVLLVEDHLATRNLIRRLLTDAGYAVLAAPDAEAALEIESGREAPIDLLLSDVVLPGLGGRELVELVRSRRPGVVAILMSGYALDGDGELDGCAFLQKPFDRHALSAKLLEVAVDLQPTVRT